jgi:putative transposase
VQDGGNPMLTGGGLIRTQGGWSLVLALRRKGQQERSDERILGSGDFVDQVLQEAEERELHQIKLRRQGVSIEEIIREEYRKRKVSEKPPLCHNE